MLRGIVLASLLIATLVVVSIWLGKIHSDLNWDEAQSYRNYARHPLTALTLYLDPNNHPLESLYRSLYWTVGGVSKSGFYRLPGLVLVAGFLVATGWALWPWLRRRAWIAAAFFLLGLLTASETQVQALQLRGYFPSMLLLVVILGRLLRRVDRPPDARALWTDALLTSLLLFTLPSNLFLLPALWTGYWVVEPAASRAERGRRLFLRASRTAGMAALCYLPIVIGTLLGINHLDRFPASDPAGAGSGFLTGIRTLISQAAPVGLPWEIFAGVAVGLLGLALARHPGGRDARAALGLWGIALLTVAVFSVIKTAPPRIFSPFVVLAWASLAAAVLALTRGWSERLQVALAVLMAAAVLTRIPDLQAANHPRHVVSDIVNLVGFQGDPNEERFLLCADTVDLWFGFARAFGEENVIFGAHHVDDAFRGTLESPERALVGWKAGLRRRFFPELDRPPIDSEAVDILVLAREEDYHPDPGHWAHPALDSLRARIPLVETVHFPPYHLEIHRR